MKPELKRVYEVLKEIQDRNKLKNDSDSYQYELIEYAFGLRTKPKPEDFGMEEFKK